jgi:WD40 repeat protein
VGTDVGHIIHGMRFGKLSSAAPASYAREDNPLTGDVAVNNSDPISLTAAAAAGGDVLCLSFSSAKSNVFLAGYGDGSICLYDTSFSSPLTTWETQQGVPIINVVWSTSRPAVFFALSTSNLYVWDLLNNAHAPVVNESYKKRGQVRNLAISEAKGGTTQPSISLVYDDGHIEVHVLNSKLVIKTDDEDSKFGDFIARL